MKKLNSIMLRSVLAGPLMFSEIDPVKVEFVGDVKVKADKATVTVTSKKGAGGHIFPLPQAIPLSDENLKMSWEWAVSQFSAAQPQIPLTKATDDYPLRIGLLLSDGEFRIPLKWYVKMRMKSKGLTLSYMVFYGAVREAQAPYKCAMSPVTKNTLNCLMPATEKLSALEVKPLQDVKQNFSLTEDQLKKLKILGVWIFADSDNVKSQSAGVIRNIKFQ